ncbi:flagellar basal body-associated FliL family protein [Sphingomonas psychrotolerans]|uniref:Flagellar protein FliL n=1 Tax=Sphingomonas psychrotolerans TaxID=1327635 RepID=A0ABU3N1R3_9SPHN|nr:flagellar basal body-associated FliL family protein [Sphingomonas psychrotolerans]MDT8758494.1 flagellar basal body-associated FliL family protein [Sphingomonas psychrotolerans]
MSSPEIVEEGAEGAKPAAPKSKKKLIIIGAAAGVLLLGGGGGAAMMLSGGSAKAEAPAEGHGEEAAPEAEGGHGGGEGESKEAFVDVPAMVVNLRSPDGASRFLKIHFMIVPGPKGSPETLKDKLPLILDAYQPFLRELRPEDLAGSAAVFRIKEEMLVRATEVSGAGMVKDILIQDLVQQ